VDRGVGLRSIGKEVPKVEGIQVPLFSIFLSNFFILVMKIGTLHRSSECIRYVPSASLVCANEPRWCP